MVEMVDDRRLRRWPWVLGLLAGFTVLCCGAAIEVSNATKKIHSEYPAYVSLAMRPRGSVGRTTFGWNRSAELRHKVRQYDPHAESSLVEILTDDGTPEPRSIALIALTRSIHDPAEALDKLFASEGSLESVTTQYPQLGGHFACGTTRAAATDTWSIVCGWADHGSYGMAIFLGPWTMDEGATTLRDIRDEVVHRGVRPTR